MNLNIRALAFDVNGTLVDILTDEGLEEIYRSIRHFLTYQGIDLSRGELRDLYFRLMKEQQTASTETYVEYDAVAIWRRIIEAHQTDYTRGLPAEKLRQMPQVLAEMYRGISRKRLEVYPYVIDVLNRLCAHYPMAIVTDAQSAYALGELHKVGLLDYFNPIIVSGDFGYRKPDPRLFRKALDGMGVSAEQTLFVGNDMYRDIYGAQQAGMQTIMFESGQGDRTYEDVKADFTMSDYRDLLTLLTQGQAV